MFENNKHFKGVAPNFFVQFVRLIVCTFFLERGARPVTNFLRNLSALSNWHSVYTSAIAFIVSGYMSFPF